MSADFDRVLHVGVLRDVDHQRPSVFVPDSIVVACDGCGRDLWVDPACCAEVGAAHDHACYTCAGPIAGDEVRIPIAALRAVENYLRRN